MKIGAKVVKIINTNKLNYKIMKENSLVLKCASITNNVLDGATSFISLEENLEHKKNRYVVTIQRSTTTQRFALFFNSYEEAKEVFNNEIILATVL